MRRAIWALVAVASCGKDPLVETGDSDVIVETGVDSDLPESWTDVDLAPADLTVGVGAVVHYTLRATSSDGTRRTPEGVTWRVSNLPVAGAGEGAVTALAGGETRVIATWEGGEASAWLHVDAAGTMQVTVTDTAGDGLVEAHVQIGASPVPRTDEDGRTSGEVGPEPVSVCAWAAGYVPLCATRVVGRRVTLPLRTSPSTDSPSVAGDVDLSAVDTSGAPDAIVVGIVAPSRPGDPRFHPIDELLGPNRTVVALGLDVDLPSNVVVKQHAEAFTAPGVAGPRTLWSIATLVPIVDALAAGAGTVDPLTVLGRNMGRAVRTERGVTVADVGVVDGGLLAPDVTLTAPVSVATGPLPIGAAGDEVPLLLAWHDDGLGVVIDGLAAGQGAVTVGTEGAATHVVGLVQAGGLGLGGTEVYVSAPVQDGVVALPDWPPFPVLPTFHPPATLSSRTCCGDFVRMTGRDRHDHLRDVVAPVGDVDLVLPDIEAPFERGIVDWDVWVVTTDRGAYESWLAVGAIDEAALSPVTIGTAHATGDVYATP